MNHATPNPLLTTIAAIASAAMLAACGPDDGTTGEDAPAKAAPTSTAAPPTRTPAPAPKPRNGGTITAVVPIVAEGEASGAGAVVGGVLGAAVGNQVGGGDGKKIATVLGALGGAKIGHEVEKKKRETITGYRIEVALDAGGTRSFTRADAGGFASGQRVRVVDGQLLPA